MKTADFTCNIDDEADVKVEFEKIAQKISQNTELETIYLKENRLGANEIEGLVASLKQHKNIKMLDLSGNDIHADAMPFIVEIIKGNPTIETILLNYNKINDNDIEALMKGANTVGERLLSVEINLASNRITEPGLISAESLSPSSVLSILSGNFIKDKALIDRCRETAFQRLNALEIATKQTKEKTMLPTSKNNHNNSSSSAAITSHYSLRNRTSKDLTDKNDQQSTSNKPFGKK